MATLAQVARSRGAFFLFSLQVGCSAEVVGLELGPPPDSDRPDAPTRVTVDFPAPVSLTDATFLTIRGHASDADGLKSVRVNGAIAETTDDFASWQLTVPLSPGENVLEVESEDRAGNLDARAARVDVRSEPLLFMSPTALVVDEAARRALVVDQEREQLIAVDLDTGRRSLLSGESRGRGPTRSFLTQIALDESRRRAILVDSPAPFRPDEGAIMAIDLDTGDRTIISDATTGAGPLFSGALGVAVESGRHRAWLLAQSGDGKGPRFETWALIAIDLDTGDRTIVSDPITGAGRSLIGGRGMALDEPRQRALIVIDGNGYTGLIAVDLETGDRISITDPLTEFGVGHNPRGAVLDAGNNRVLTLADDGRSTPPRRELVAIDVSTGDRAEIPVRGAAYGYGAIAFDEEAGHPLVVVGENVTQEWQIGQLMAVDVDTGVSTRISTISVGTGPAIAAPSDLAVDASTGRALVLDRNNGLVAVDLGTSERTIISVLKVAGEAALSPARFALDDANRRALVVGSSGPGTNDRLVSVDLRTGEVAPLDGGGADLSGSRGIALDTARNRALVSPFAGPGSVALAAVDLSTGTRTALITAEIGQGPLFIFDGLTIDGGNTRALSINYINNGLVALGLLTFALTTISEDQNFSGPWLGTAIVLDEAEQHALVAGNGLISVSLDTGDRTILSGPEPGPSLPTGVARYSSPCCALIADDGLDALVLVDRVTGERVLLSGHALPD